MQFYRVYLRFAANRGQRRKRIPPPTTRGYPRQPLNKKLTFGGILKAARHEKQRSGFDKTANLGTRGVAQSLGMHLHPLKTTTEEQLSIGNRDMFGLHRVGLHTFHLPAVAPDAKSGAEPYPSECHQTKRGDVANPIWHH